MVLRDDLVFGQILGGTAIMAGAYSRKTSQAAQIYEGSTLPQLTSQYTLNIHRGNTSSAMWLHNRQQRQEAVIVHKGQRKVACVAELE